MRYLSSKLMLVFAALILGVNVGFAQSACPSNGNFHNCFGTFIWHYGDKYVGDWKDGKRAGQGTYTYTSCNMVDRPFGATLDIYEGGNIYKVRDFTNIKQL